MSGPAAPSCFSTAMSDLLGRVSCRAVAGAEFDDVCRLRHDAYRRERHLPADAPNPFSDRYDRLPTTTSFGVYVAGELAGSLRVHVFDRDRPDSPATSDFPDVVGKWPTPGRASSTGRASWSTPRRRAPIPAWPTWWSGSKTVHRVDANGRCTFRMRRCTGMAGQHYDPTLIVIRSRLSSPGRSSAELSTR